MISLTKLLLLQRNPKELMFYLQSSSGQCYKDLSIVELRLEIRLDSTLAMIWFVYKRRANNIAFPAINQPHY